MFMTPCVIWTGRLNEYGYGTIGIHLAHRRAYEEQVGPIPEGLELDHVCGVRACVNVQHLEPVTHSENIRRSWARRPPVQVCPRGHEGRYTKGSNGKRHCTECKNERSREARQARRLGSSVVG